jgi:phosphate uptake regulator
MYSIVKGMQADIITSLIDGDNGIIKMIPDRDDEIDRLYFLLVRIIRSAAIDPMLAAKYSISQIDCLDFRVAANVLESVGDTSVSLARNLSEIPRPMKISKIFGRSILEVHQLLMRTMDSGVNSLLSKNADKARETAILFDTFSQALSVLRDRGSKKFPSEIGLLSSVFDGMARIAQSSVDIADLSAPIFSAAR